jgi:hypothetical protein
VHAGRFASIAILLAGLLALFFALHVRAGTARWALPGCARSCRRCVRRSQTGDHRHGQGRNDRAASARPHASTTFATRRRRPHGRACSCRPGRLLRRHGSCRRSRRRMATRAASAGPGARASDPQRGRTRRKRAPGKSLINRAIAPAYATVGRRDSKVACVTDTVVPFLGTDAVSTSAWSC